MKNDTLRRAAALMAALSITVSLAAPAFAGTYYIDYGDITITKNADGSQTVQYGKEDGSTATDNDSGEIIITTSNKATTTLESDLEGPAAEDSGFGPVVEDNYQPAAPAQPEGADQQKDADQPEGADRQESAEEPKDADQPEDAEEPKDADQQESADQQKDADQPEGADQQESADQQKDADQQEGAGQQKDADQQAQPLQVALAPAAAPAASTPKNDKGNGVFGNIITVINNATTALKLTLKDVKIDVSDTGEYGRWGTSTKGNAALSVQGNGNVEIELDGKNELKSGTLRAGLEKTSTGTLTLKDDNQKDDNQKAGSLTATGSYGGAGIGGGAYGEGNNITITGGTVIAAGGINGAGIGGGHDRSGKNITIKGGRVTATGGNRDEYDDFGGAAGIGGGAYGNGEDITIKDGTVTATGGRYGAGIGGGEHGEGKNITITGGTVNATGGEGGAGIGGGAYGNGKNITINGGTVTATGGVSGAGIGGGCGEGNGEGITINGGTVNAAGGVSGAGIGGGAKGSGSNVTVSGAAQVTTTAGKRDDGYFHRGAGATIGNGGNRTPGGEYVDGEEIQADISGVTTGYIHHIIYDPALISEDNPKGIVREWWEPERPQPNPEDPNAPTEESNEVDLGAPSLHVETLEGDPLPFNAQQQGSTLRVTSDTLAARLHGNRQALEALQEQGVEQIQFVTTLKTTTLSVEDLLAEGGSWFALEHNGLVSRQLSAAQAESLKCRMR